jgi:hypothetical protein
MSKYQMDGNCSGLPKPVALTPEEVQEVAAGSGGLVTAASAAPAVSCPVPPIAIGLVLAPPSPGPAKN